MKTLAALTLGACVVMLAAPAIAEDSVRLEEHEAKGYFDKVGRVGGFAGMVTGDMPTTSNATGTPTVTSQQFKRTGFGLDFDLLGFWDATRFDTLIGAELVTKLGYYSGRKVDGESATAQDKSFFTFRMDAAADYGLLHWDGPMKGRISGGAGFGFDFDGGRWWTQSGRAYPLLLGRVQLAVGAVGLHAAYHFVPTTTNDALVREHRFEAAAGVGSLHAGLRYIITPARFSDATDWFVTREAGAFMAYAF